MAGGQRTGLPPVAERPRTAPPAPDAAQAQPPRILPLRQLGNRAAEAYYAGQRARMAEPEAAAAVAAPVPVAEEVEAAPPPDAAPAGAGAEAVPAAAEDATPAPAEEVAEGAPQEDAPAAPADAPPDAALPEAAADAAEEAGPSLGEWRARVLGSTAAIVAPPVPEGGALRAAATARGVALAEGRRGARAGLPAAAQAAVRPPPEPDTPPAAPPQEPVQAATDRVEGTAGRRLRDARLSDLAPSPRGTQPLVRDPAGARAAQPAAPDAASPAPEPLTSEAPGMPPESQMCMENIAAATQAPVPELAPGSATGVTISDTPVPPPPPLPAPVRTGMAQIIARLLADPAGQAQPIIDKARAEAYPNAILNSQYPEIGNDRAAGVTAALSAQLRRVAEQAGVTGAELEAAVAARRAEVAAAANQSRAEAEAGGEAGTEAVCREGGAEESAVEAARDGVEAHTGAVVDAAAGADSPAVINRRRDEQIGRLNRRAARLRVDYETARLRRHAALESAGARQQAAYDETERQDAAAITAAGRPETAMADIMERGRIRFWADTERRRVGNEVARLKAEATTDAEGFRAEVATALSEATTMVRDWASGQTTANEGFFEGLLRRFREWGQLANAEAEVWAEERAGEARDATLVNAGLLSQFVASQGETVDLATNAAFQSLSAEQQEVIRAYYAAPPGARDSLGAVAAGLRYRLAAEERESLISAMQAEVMAKPDSDAYKLQAIGQAETAGFSAERIADQLYKAMYGGVTGWGTDEDAIFAALSGAKPLQGKAVRAMYRESHGRDLDADLRDEMGGAELDRAEAQLRGDAVVEAVATLRDAMDDWYGTDEDAIMRALRGKTPEQRAAIVAEYRRRYGRDLDLDLEGDLSGHDLERARALREGDTARADAIAIDQAMHGGFLGLGIGTDEGQIEGVYADIRADVAAQQVLGADGRMRPMTEPEMEAEIARRNQAVEGSYNVRYGAPGDGESALRQAYRSDMSGPELDLANALADNDLVAADAARLETERRGIIYTDDDAVNAVLETQYQRELDRLQRDPDWRARRDALRRRATEENWDPYQVAAAERNLDRELAAAARAGGARNMQALEGRYNARYDSTGLRGGLDGLIRANMSGTDREKAQKLREQGGWLTPAQRVDFASRGLGTDEADFTRATEGLTAREIEDMNRELAAMGRPTVQEIAAEELDGREGFDMRLRLRGVPENAQQEMALAEARVNWELVNSPITGHERDVMTTRLARMQAEYRLLTDPATPAAERARATAQFRGRGTGMQSAVELYRARVDAVTDAVTTAVALVTAIAVTVATGGLAGAILGALAAAAMSMLYKSALKGAAYGGEEMALDAVIGIVDAAAAAATFGVGNALLRVASAGKPAVGRLASSRLAAALSRMAQTGRRASRILAHGVAEGIEGAAGALPSALAGNLLNDANWEHGNPALNILSGTMVQTGFGGLVSGGIGGLGGIGRPHLPVPDVTVPRGARPEFHSGDILGARGTPMDRLSAWRAFKAENPEARMGDFLRQFDAAAEARLKADALDAGLQRQMRGAVLAGMPPAARRDFAGIRVEVLPEADFRALTRSESGVAVTLVENGRPRIVLNGAPEAASLRLAALREEGVHLAQLADPELGPLVLRLDEARMKGWDRLSVGERVELYRLKIGLEADAQIRLMRGLAEDFARLPPRAARNALAEQIARAEATLMRLEARAAEVARIGLLQRIAMATGLKRAPQFLDQPARLFNKGLKKAANTNGPPVFAVPDDAALPARGALVTDSPYPARSGVPELQGRLAENVAPARLSEIELKDGAQFRAIPEGGAEAAFRVKDGQLQMQTGTRWRPAKPGKYTRPDAGGPAFEYNGGRRVHVRRHYRKVEFFDPAKPDVVLELREETLHLNRNDLSFTHWDISGGDIAKRGRVAEAQSRLMSAALAADPKSGVLASFQVQRADGTGFDGVELRIDAEGRPYLAVVEVKAYPDNWVGYHEFTAVSRYEGNPAAGLSPGNLDDNLADMAARLRPTRAERIAAEAEAAARLMAQDGGGAELDRNLEFLADLMNDGPMAALSRQQPYSAAELAAETERILDGVVAQRLGIAADQARQVRAALEAGDVELLLRLSPGTRVGNRGAQTTLPRLRTDWEALLGKDVVKRFRGVRVEEIEAKAIAAMAAHPGVGPSGVAAAPFISGAGQVFDVVPVPSGGLRTGAGGSVEAFAGVLAERLRSAVILPDGSHRELGLVVDLSDLIGDKEALRAAILAALQARNLPAGTLGRVAFVLNRR